MCSTVLYCEKIHLLLPESERGNTHTAAREHFVICIF